MKQVTAPRVGVVGASGYSGAVAARLVATHPNLELVFCTSDQRAGQSVSEALGVRVNGDAKSDLTYVPNAEAKPRARDVDVVLLATSAEVSSRLAPAILEDERLVVDLSGAFRLANAETYARFYRGEHPHPELLGRVHYGLPELFGAPVRPQGEPLLVANPGCYPTAALLAIAPLLRAGLVEPHRIVIDAKSGVTGAGRQAKEEYSFGEVDEDVRAYKLLSHQHTPEIARHLARATRLAEDAVHLTFTPHLLPVKRGILATCYATPRPGATARACHEALQTCYADTRFVEVTAPERVTLTSVVGTNRVRVGVTANDDVVVAVASIDNLLKGAAGQAIQNVNLALGLDEGAGLVQLHRSAP